MSLLLALSSHSALSLFEMRVWTSNASLRKDRQRAVQVVAARFTRGVESCPQIVR